MQHITRRHILLETGPFAGFFLTQGMLPIANQGASKYLFQDNVQRLSDAQQLVRLANAVVFEAAKGSPTSSHGNIVMTVGFPPTVDSGVIRAFTGFDYKRGFTPTLSITLVLDSNCRDVLTSYPGRP